MLQKNTIFAVLVLPAFIGSIFLSAPLEALAKTVYVEKDGDDSNDGSADNPYKSLEKAADKVNDGEADEVRVGKGTFSGGATFNKGVTVKGDGRGDTTINGALVFHKKANLRDVSIRGKHQNAITVGKDGEAVIENVDIRDFLGIGIWVQAGSGVLTVKDSRIGGSSGKGVYAEAGTKLTVTESTIVNNKQEGIDIRQNTRGTIKNNSIEENNESGIELIVGSSDFTISGNKIKNNDASGIAFQFYELKKKLGTIRTMGNTISGSRKYGVDCNKPSGGESPAGYWADSITLEENTFANNKMADVSTKCKLLEAKTEEEEKALEEQLKAEEKKEEAAVTPVVPDAQAEEKMRQQKQALEEVVLKIEGVVKEERYRELISQAEGAKLHEIILNRGKNKALEDFRVQIAADRNEILSYLESMQGIGNYTDYPDLQERVSSQEQKLSDYDAKLASLETNGSLKERIPHQAITKIAKFIYGALF